MILKKLFYVMVFLAFISLSANGETKIVVSANIDDIRTDAIKKILTTAYEKMGIKLEVSVMPNKRIIKVMNDHEIDGMLYNNPGIMNAVPDIIQIPVIIAYEDISVFSKKYDLKINGVDSLKTYKVGVISGMGNVIKDFKKLNLDESNTPEQQFLKLDKDRVDLVIFPRIGGMMMLKNMNIGGIKILTPPLDRIPLFHYLDKKNKNIAEKLTSTLKEMENDGTINKINDEFEVSLSK